MPLDDGVELLGPKFNYAKFCKFRYLWPKAVRSSFLPVSAQLEALILLIPPVY